MTESIKNELKINEAKVIKKIEMQLYIGCGLLIFSNIIIILAFYGTLLPENETPETWFARSGAAVTVLSLFSFDTNNRIYQLLNPIGVVGGSSININVEKRDLLLQYSNLLKYLSLVLAIIGTLIWGYGDILFAS